MQLLSNLSNLELNLELNLEPGTESGTVWHLMNLLGLAEALKVLTVAGK